MENVQNSTIPFLDVLLIRIPQKIIQLYIIKSQVLIIHALEFVYTQQLEVGDTQNVSRACETCSTDEYLQHELKHIQSTFNEINNYPHWVISKVFKEIKNKQPYYTISLSRHEQVCLIGLHFERYFSQWWEKYLSKRSPLKHLKHTCSWRDKLIVLWILNSQAKIFLRINSIISVTFLKIMMRHKNNIC